MGFGPYPGMLRSDPAATAQDDDYELRRARTPVPEFVAEAVEIHLSKVYDQEVTRDGPTDLTEWWKDVDGRGTPIDDWMLKLSHLFCSYSAASTSASITRRPHEAKGSRRGPTNCGLAWTSAWPPTSYLRTWFGGGVITPAVMSNAWSANIKPGSADRRDKNGVAVNADDAGEIGEAWRKNYVQMVLEIRRINSLQL